MSSINSRKRLQRDSEVVLVDDEEIEQQIAEYEDQENQYCSSEEYSLPATPLPEVLITGMSRMDY